jgi:dolichyl-phosphate beta-glucosyltransferase
VLKEIDFSIIIPAYNEEHRIVNTLSSLVDYLRTLTYQFEIIVVNDGSSDRTEDVVRSFLAGVSIPNTCLSRHENLGKGYTIKEGVAKASGRAFLFMDADGSTKINEIEKLINEFNCGELLVCGSRATSDAKVNTVWYRKSLGRIFNSLVNLLLIDGVKDTQCGFKLFEASLAKYLFFHQTINRFSFDVELIYLASRSKIKIKEVGVEWENVKGSKVNLITDSTRMFLDLLIIRFNHLSTPKYQEWSSSIK